MFYDNNKCDKCGKIMHDGEDIVVCPVCGTPQHRECYNEEKKCVNEHLHKDGFKWKPEFVPEPPKPKTEEQEKTEIFGNTTPIMPMTGTRAENIFLKNVLFDPNDEFDGVKVREAATFFQQGAPRYIRKFMRKKDKKITWNWAAFVFSPFWFFYRKLYKVGLILLCLSIALSIAVNTFTEKMTASSPEFSAAMQEYVNSAEEMYDENGNFSLEALNAVQNRVITASRNNGHILIKMFALKTAVILLQGIVSALIADFLLRKRLKKIVNLSREVPDENTKIYTIARSGGVSYIMTLFAIVVAMYLPDIIYSIADKINF